jgi:hypothetical protein
MRGDFDMPLKKGIRVFAVVTLLMLAGCLFSASAVWAGKNEGRISLGAGTDFATAYYFRGIIQEDEGFIAQPYADATFNLYDKGEGFNSLGVTLGIWNSFHDEQTGAAGDPKSWYEADLYGGITLGFLDFFELSSTYTAYTSPNGAFTDVHELALGLSFDDSKFLGAFALSPYLALAFEIDGQADGGSNEGVYLELGIEPGFTLGEGGSYPVAVSFPLKVGLSLDDYYEDPNTGSDETFGYFDGGIAVSTPLAFIPESFGSWEVSAAGHFLALGDSLETINGGDNFEAIGIFGISLSY